MSRTVPAAKRTAKKTVPAQTGWSVQSPMARASHGRSPAKSTARSTASSKRLSRLESLEDSAV